ncbi:MAG: hypothetical protein CL609_04370 [Anaerolineaceae bacterium]|nr:hypothetical protein [Anaerolineaceae bacterium]
MQMFSTKKLSQLLTYPFKAEDANKKILIGSLFVLAGFIIPIIPFFFVLGYATKISKRITSGDGKLTLPEWKDWDILFKDGARLFGIYLVYSLPAIIVFGVGFILYFGSIIPVTINESSGLAVVSILFGMSALFLSIGVGLLLSLVESIFLPSAIMHAIQKESFAAGFQIKQWWTIFRNNLAGFVVAFIFMFGLTYLLYFAVVISIYTFILAIISPFLSAFLGFYLVLIIFPLMAQAYYEGNDHLETKQEDLS